MFAIYGTGGFGREVAPLAASLDQQMPKPQGIVLVDDHPSQKEINGYPVLDFKALCAAGHCQRKVVVAIGDGHARQKVTEKCERAGLQLGSITASSSQILDDNEIGFGLILCGFASITSNARIGKSFHGNIYSYIAHDCLVGDYVTLAPKACINGNVHIGDFAYIGTDALIRQGRPGAPLKIGEGAVIGMGAIITKDVEPYTVMVGLDEVKRRLEVKCKVNGSAALRS